ncbi:hypothetical protein [Streptococcus sp. zg-JUN1979]|uniref:beta-sandwich lipoprotein n=1 Tax=Streptococcus sp. zg-JUN1979 TaxID=3391450 RepID=UPI0039A55914
MKRKSLVILLASVLACVLVGCSQASRVSNNLAQEADNFNTVRKVTVLNAITNDIMFEMSGRMSIKADTQDHQLEVIVEDENGQYQKHIVGLSDNVSYVVQDVTSKDVDKYKYTINFNPKMWVPVGVEKVD